MEAALSTSKYIALALILGDRQPYTGALIAPDFDELGRWASAHDQAGVAPEQLIERREVQKLIDAEVRRTLDPFAIFERPRRVALLPRLLTEEAGELTPSLKTKNRVVLANWADKVRELFPDDPQDGRD
jgi:long-chain acyl-CoA synthetase